ncbi:hypothetical protein CCMSSC00406_0008835 [Pleurotus cornucopiae]|uniref:Uncharacterized protein n=1 Tax=Pleurotus cornucopiae TaxID=5321 RepID=A0ACB7IKD3_PLECO|nr:hypothetical protein CCMSSC00406_0008835 [Pleurotus cornucopiae]
MPSMVSTPASLDRPAPHAVRCPRFADFCLRAPIHPNSTIPDTEGEEVARHAPHPHIPAGALSGVQFTRTPNYVQVVGFVDQRLINIQHPTSNIQTPGFRFRRRARPARC